MSDDADLSPELLERVERIPWGLIREALEYEARDEPCPEELLDAVNVAAAVLVALALRESGMSEDAICDLFDEREWNVKLGYSFDSHEMSCSVEWAQGNGVTVTGKHAAPVAEVES